MLPLPKFLIADNSQEQPEQIYVIHTQTPRCIIEGNIEDFYENQRIHWLDNQPVKQEEIDKLVKTADEFLVEELENQELLYDEEFDD